MGEADCISILGALFIPFPIVVFIFAGALAFASASSAHPCTACRG